MRYEKRRRTLTRRAAEVGGSWSTLELCGEGVVLATLIVRLTIDMRFHYFRTPLVATYRHRSDRSLALATWVSSEAFSARGNWDLIKYMDTWIIKLFDEMITDGGRGGG